MSLRTLATLSDFSPSFISQVEGDIVSPSIASLEKLTSALGTTLGEFFSALESPARSVVRPDERATYESAWSRSKVAVLTDAGPGRKLSALQVTFEPGGVSGKRPEAGRQDTFALLLSGTLVLRLEDREVALGAGDAAYLTEGQLFAWECRGNEPATLLLVGATGRRETITGTDNGDSGEEPR